MPLYPILRPVAQQRLTTAVFPGYDCRDRRSDGAMAHTENLSTDRYPSLSVRPKRGTVRTLSAPGGLLAKAALALVDNGTLYYNGLATPVTGLAAGEKQLVSMGAYIVIFPDKVYFNTEDWTDYGSMEAVYESRGEVKYSLCRSDGTDFERVYVGDQEPEDTSFELWLSTAGGTVSVLSYSAAAGSWVELDTVYTKLSFSTCGELPRLFAAGDGVTISGAAFDEANGEKILYTVGGGGGQTDFAVIVGLLESAMTQTEGSVRIERRVPALDFVCEAGNRLWGCFYGASGGVILNELYCCALGDFKNWRQYRGLSTDSWTASIGSDGPWTGAVNYLGCPTFFKENRIHQVAISSVGAHAVQETACRGVQKGSAKSLQVVHETLFYKSRADVCAWQGGFPESVGAPLGEERYSGAVGGALGGKYYLSMQNGAGAWQLFAFDIDKGLWIREDGLHALQFAAVGDELYAIDAVSGALLALRGSDGTPEESLSWEAVTGVLAYEYPDRKTLSRYVIRARLAPGARATVYLEYDDSGEWIESGTLSHGGLGTALLPIRPRRCDHLRMKISGTGETEILSITRVLEIGSDV